MCILIQTVLNQNHVFATETTVFNKLLPNVEEIMDFQEKVFKTALDALNKSDIKKVLKLSRTYNRSVSINHILLKVNIFGNAIK